jgi:hypothetical protein
MSCSDGDQREFFKRKEVIPGVGKCKACLMGLPQKTKGSLRKVDLQEDKN